MANLSATSPWIEAGKGIQSAIQNVGAIQGIIRNKNLMEREEAEAPLRMENLQRQGRMQDLQMQEMEIGNKPVSVDDTLQKMFPDRPMTKKLVEDLAIPFMETDPQGKRFVRNKNIPKIFEQMNTLQFSQKAALSTLADIDLKIETLKPKKDETGKEIAVDPITKERNQMEIDRLNEQKGNLKKMYKLLHSGDIVETVDEKGVSHWFDKTTGELVKELEGKKGARATTSPQIKPVPDPKSPTGYTYSDVSGGGQPAPVPGATRETWGPEQAGPGGTKRQVSGSGKISTTYTPPTSATKPDYTPKQAMAKISAINSAISRMKTTGMIDTTMAIQNPLLAGLVDTKDPEAIKQAILTLEAEREEVLKYAPKGFVEKIIQQPKAPEPKKLDEATAKAILKEAGGDKKKAREIATQRGYSF